MAAGESSQGSFEQGEGVGRGALEAILAGHAFGERGDQALTVDVHPEGGFDTLDKGGSFYVKASDRTVDIVRFEDRREGLDSKLRRLIESRMIV